ELWHDDFFGSREEMDFIMVSSYPNKEDYSKKLIKEFQIIQDIVSEIRNIRNQKQIPQKESLELSIHHSELDFNVYSTIIEKLANIPKVTLESENIPGARSIQVGKEEYVINLENKNEVDAERERIEKDIADVHGFLIRVNKKLN